MIIEEKANIGLSCVCVQEIYNLKHKYLAKFFLFSDVDSKNKEELRLVTQQFARKGLTFFVYETLKGYHVISPDLLEIPEWYEQCNLIKQLTTNYYRFHVIRINKKIGDNANCDYFTEFYNKDHKLSYEFIKLINEKYKTAWLPPADSLADKTYLQLVHYTHHEIDI